MHQLRSTAQFYANDASVIAYPDPAGDALPAQQARLNEENRARFARMGDAELWDVFARSDPTAPVGYKHRAALELRNRGLIN